MTLSTILMTFFVFLFKFVYWSNFNVNMNTGFGVMTGFFYKGLSRNPEIINAPAWVLPYIWRLWWVRDTKFRTNVYIEMLLNAAKCRKMLLFIQTKIARMEEVSKNYLQLKASTECIYLWGKNREKIKKLDDSRSQNSLIFQTIFKYFQILVVLLMKCFDGNLKGSQKKLITALLCQTTVLLLKLTYLHKSKFSVKFEGNYLKQIKFSSITEM